MNRRNAFGKDIKLIKRHFLEKRLVAHPRNDLPNLLIWTASTWLCQGVTNLIKQKSEKLYNVSIHTAARMAVCSCSFHIPARPGLHCKNWKRVRENRKYMSSQNLHMAQTASFHDGVEIVHLQLRVCVRLGCSFLNAAAVDSSCKNSRYCETWSGYNSQGLRCWCIAAQLSINQ